MFPCPAGLRLLRDYNYDLLIDRITSGATELYQLKRSARRVGICIAYGGPSVYICSGPGFATQVVATYVSPNQAHSGMFWADELGPAIFDNMTLQFNGGPALARLWEVTLPTDYKE